MLILILIYVQYSQKAVFSFEKDLDSQNHSFSDSHHPVKNILQPKFPIPATLNIIWKNLNIVPFVTIIEELKILLSRPSS